VSVNAERIKAVVTEFVQGLPDTTGEVSTLASFEDLGVDSMSTMDLLFKVEKEFGVEVPDDQLPMIVNIQDLVNFVATATRKVNR
jgi:acyl carrier protein